MHAGLIFVGLVVLRSFGPAESYNRRFRVNMGNGGEKINSDVNLPESEVDLSRAKVDLPQVEIDLYGGELDLTVAKVDLFEGMIDITKAKLDLSGGYIPKRNEDLTNCSDNLPAAEAEGKIPSHITYCFTTTFTVVGRPNPEAAVISESSKVGDGKFQFAVEVRGSESRLILHNYKEEFGDSFSWMNKPTKCCVSWVSSRKEFHLYLEGKHVLGGIGSIRSVLPYKVEDVVLGGKTREAVSGPMTDLEEWNRALSKDEVEKVSFGYLTGNQVKESFPSFKISAVEINEPFQKPVLAAEVQTNTTAVETTTIKSVLAAEVETNTTAVETTTIKSCPHPTLSKVDYKDNRLNSIVATELELPKLANLYELSVCLWIYVNSTSVFSAFEYHDLKRSRIELWYNGVDFLYYFNKENFEIPGNSPVMGKWHQVCLLWSAEANGTVYAYTDGNQVLRTGLKKGGALNATGGYLIFSQKQSAPFDPNNPEEGFTFKVSGIELWDSVLTQEQVMQVYRCPSDLPGNVMTWAQSQLAVNTTGIEHLLG